VIGVIFIGSIVFFLGFTFFLNHQGFDCLRKGKYDEAISWFSKLNEIKPNAGLYCVIGDVYSAKNDYGLAIENYSKAIELHPEYAIHI
jgi:tetratricopeptide (TPR) repeat protein